jgi:hypothetical protein
MWRGKRRMMARRRNATQPSDGGRTRGGVSVGDNACAHRAIAIAGRSRGEGAATAGGRARARGGVVERGSEDGPPPHPSPPPGGDCAVGTPPSGTTLAPAAPSPSPDDPGGKAPRRREDAARARGGVVERCSEDGPPPHPPPPPGGDCAVGTPPSGTTLAPAAPSPSPYDPGGKAPRRREDARGRKGASLSGVWKTALLPTLLLRRGGDCAVGTPPSGTTPNDAAILVGLARMGKIRGSRLTYCCCRSWGRARGRLVFFLWFKDFYGVDFFSVRKAECEERVMSLAIHIRVWNSMRGVPSRLLFTYSR